MRRMTPLDAAWLTVDSRDTPMHVATLVILSKPKNAAPSYLQDLVDEFQGARSFVPPWNLRIRQSALKNVLPVVEVSDEVRMRKNRAGGDAIDAHVRREFDRQRAGDGVQSRLRSAIRRVVL